MILPRKIDIDRAKAEETRRQIDEGMALARKVDSMRELKVEQERNIMQWKDVTVKAVQKEIDDLIYEKNTLQRQIQDARERRDGLLKPLTAELIQNAQLKKEIEKEKNELFLDKELFNQKQDELEQEKVHIQNVTSHISKSKNDADKAKSESVSLKDMARKEYEIAIVEREHQTREHEKKLAMTETIRRQYEVALATIELREKQVQEREDEIIIREQDVVRRVRNLQGREK